MVFLSDQFRSQMSQSDTNEIETEKFEQQLLQIIRTSAH
jgi:hypothetical protein